MSVIKILSDQEAKKIAAGEVVERPASVVKELLENSLDAGSTKISLYIESSGKKLIRVVDNGCGMLPKDAKLCFINHATSKVTSLDDLKTIQTFGFRGEALASISSVSIVTLKTRYNSGEQSEDVGIKISYVDGEFEKEEEIACAGGTDLQIKDLFYNTPVRQKFLKQDETEWNQIQSLFHAFCLSNLHVHFQLYRDKKETLNAPPAQSVKDRVGQIWGYNMTQNVVDLESEQGNGNKESDNKNQNKNNKLKINGLISRHNFWKYGRQYMFFFVNNRWVKNTELSKAIIKGYRGVLPPARFPATFLFLELDTNAVDINVHPRKEEVRFAKPVTVANAVQRRVTQTLENLINEQLREIEPSKEHEVFEEEAQEFFKDKDKATFYKKVSHEKREEKYTKNYTQDIVTEEIIEKKSSSKIIGQLLKTYIVVENNEGLLLIDQHAAHERILYEKYLKNFEQKDGTILIFPEIITLSDYRLNIVIKEKDFLNKQGIEIEQIGPDKIAVKTSPPKIKSKDIRGLIFEMVEFIEQNETLDEEVFRKKLNEHVHSHMACKMAVKAGDVLSQEMMHNIVTQLQEVDNRFICVHGRPTTWRMNKAELEKTFRRR